MATEPENWQSAETAGEAAAFWWAFVLKNPKLDSGDNDPERNSLTMWAMTIRRTPSDEQLELFTMLLAGELNQRLADADPDDYFAQQGIRLVVDYHPDQLLSTCAQVAGLSSGIASWPWKTNMLVKQDKVSVRYGYSADDEVIWERQS